MSWSILRAQAPEHAERIENALTAQQHTILATVRADGSPRVSGMELDFFEGELYFGSMPGAWKGRDLDRDPRFALHNCSTLEGEMTIGDAKIAGTARRITDSAVLDRFAAWLREEQEFDPSTGFDLFGTELTEAVLIRVVGDELVFDIWKPGEGVRQTQRR
ncbi:pyridoxamine 5'-phosphate oxidase family protein [Sciscionella marina]|uniref:pyridoxamine 5'-phosphate oxidase family protein n=1 Tax=Sciscionella marina TaxID=508770 RepID=UPI000374BAA6|nr:pyridoxamine 5'-phosphate oxidase family protein [Sciscionella marina]